MKKLEHEAELYKASLAAGVAYAQQRGATQHAVACPPCVLRRPPRHR